ncbi:PREDICTED: exosome complex exonuclease RRP44 [Dufourea novaeangliae]|uniref:Protein DIS3 homolog n=1 Tax=Dufourea novaeangliae TaxID=178035 RepID=A0A154PSJ0_DUFNO|nr:PREDICTED: exosome complex exonuclease RRP44 [Dufourea novaeangliae]KZC14228.1 Exosome complex exonuclease RRP44 [Dufourea novaeangliae]
MLTTKVFFRKTKGGNVFKTVREHYLRDDIHCGSKACDKCLYRNKNIILDDEDSSVKCSKLLHPYYLLLDTNIILDQIDILEEDVIHNVIILQTVLEEVKHRSSTVYKKLKDIISNSRRRFYIFVNEHHKQTYIERKPGESMNDRNDRAIRVATKWYNNHLSTSDSNIRTVLLTEDSRNRELAKNEGIPALSMEDYVMSLENSSFLADKLCKRTYGAETGGQEFFPCHCTPVQLHDGIKNGKFLQGTFAASRENFLEGYVNAEGMEKSILIQGRSNLNRAVDGDTVAIELLAEDQWSSPSDIVLQDEVEADVDDVLETEKVLDKFVASNKMQKTPTGKIVGIIRRNWRQYCGILQPSNIEGNVRHLFVPAERKIPKIRIETRQYNVLSKQRIIVAIDSWPRNSRYPLGHFVRALGEIGDKATENEVILLEHDVPHSRFSDAVLSSLPKMPWCITEVDLVHREDLRYLDVCSVDPPGCTDIDDALHCRELSNGNLEVGVHIADVTHFIRPGTALDKEAALRATTVYLVNTRIDMIPELLSSNLCSLRGNEDRLAFSCIWEMDRDASVVNTRFCKSVICSRASMTYDEAQLRIDDSNQQDVLAISMRNLNNLAKKLKKKRLENGALVLASPEIRFRVDDETHDPIDVVAKKLKETNSMVEEFMLLANISVAKKIVTEFPECAVLRRHPEPPPANFEPLIKAGKNQGFDIIVNTGKELAESLNKCHQEGNPYFNTMLRILATRCMMQAVYFVSGMHQQSEYFHYGLACPIYTHFTSPIRRYADVMVHRLLAVCIGVDATYPDLLDKKKNHSLCHNLNYRNRMAQYAERASVALNTHLFFREKVQDEEGYILFVRKNALQVLIPKYGLEGTLYLKDNKEASVSFTYSSEDHSQTCGNIVFRTFDPVVVQICLDRSNVQHEKLIFKLVKPHIPGFSVSPVSGEMSCIVQQESTKEVTKRKADQEKVAENSTETDEGKTKKKKRKKKKN